MWRGGAVFVGLGCLTLAGVKVASAPAPPSHAEQVAVERFLTELAKPPVAYRAVRRLEASSSKLNESAWMEVFTEYKPETGFRYEVIAQGGSDRIRNRVLKKVLEAEKASFALRERRRGALSRENYDFDIAGRTPDGMIRVHLNPKRRDSRLVSGSALLSPGSGELVSLKGRLSKSPSFWVRWVNVARHYVPIGGATMPASVEFTADVKIAGVSTFAMRYEYEMVAGQTVSSPSSRILAVR
jgi:hypothetical protein